MDQTELTPERIHECFQKMIKLQSPESETAKGPQSNALDKQKPTPDNGKASSVDDSVMHEPNSTPENKRDDDIESVIPIQSLSKLENADSVEISIATARPVDNIKKNPRRRLNKTIKKARLNKRIQKLSGTLAESTELVDETNSSDPKKSKNAEFIEETPPQQILDKLAADMVFPMKKKSTKFPKAKYFCRICDYHCDSINIARTHIGDKKHLKSKNALALEYTLNHLPEPGEAQFDALTQLLTTTAKERGLSNSSVAFRCELVASVYKVLSAHIADVECVQYGSSVMRYGLNSSDVNICLTFATEEFVVMKLNICVQALNNCGLFSKVESDLQASTPFFKGVCAGTELVCLVCFNTTSSLQTVQLISDYMQIDRRLETLAICLRYWAKLCGIDSSQTGYLPPIAYIFMLIFYLQQLKEPVLPVLHEMLEEKTDLKEYLKPDQLSGRWQPRNTMSIGELWVGFFKFFVITSWQNDLVADIRSLKSDNRNERGWSGKRLAIVDPFAPKRNLARFISTDCVSHYIIDCLRSSYKYFGTPQLKTGPLFTKLTPPISKLLKDGDDATKNDTKPARLSSEEASDDQVEIRHSVSESGNDDDYSDALEEPNVDEVNVEDEEDNEDRVLMKKVMSLENEIAKERNQNVDGVSSDTEEIKQICERIASLKMTDIFYKFIQRNLNDSKPVAIGCSSCGTNGHSANHCPDDVLPPLVDLPLLSFEYVENVTNVVTVLARRLMPTRQQESSRQHLMDILGVHLIGKYADAQLQLFGSSVNGFGFGQSDLDICLTFSENSQGLEPSTEMMKTEELLARDLKYTIIIEDIAKSLKSVKGFYSVVPITNAKVPIVKFNFSRSFQGDISLYNVLAIQNTRMLKCYSTIDIRVSYLVMVMKYFAKCCDIGDASKGSLSSYAYTLMVLYFLQHCKPPLIPVLQEIYDSKKAKPECMVEGWNAWFYDDITNLKKVWPGLGRNRDSLGYLWIKLLKFYTEEFQYREHVISIRQAKPLSRLEKGWTLKEIAIEDPFDLHHNLGSGVSKKMSTYILKALIKGREVFCTSLNGMRNDQCRVEIEHMFDGDLLTNGQVPPNDRGCKRCGKIGHFARECTEFSRHQKRERDRKTSRTFSETEAQNGVVAINEVKRNSNGDKRQAQPKNNANAGQRNATQTSLLNGLVVTNSLGNGPVLAYPPGIIPLNVQEHLPHKPNHQGPIQGHEQLMQGQQHHQQQALINKNELLRNLTTNMNPPMLNQFPGVNFQPVPQGFPFSFTPQPSQMGPLPQNYNNPLPRHSSPGFFSAQNSNPQPPIVSKPLLPMSQISNHHLQMMHNSSPMRGPYNAAMQHGFGVPSNLSPAQNMMYSPVSGTLPNAGSDACGFERRGSVSGSIGTPVRGSPDLGIQTRVSGTSGSVVRPSKPPFSQMGL